MGYLNAENIISKKKVQTNDEIYEKNQQIKLGRTEQEHMLKEMTRRVESYQKHKSKKKKSGERLKSFAHITATEKPMSPKPSQDKTFLRRMSLKSNNYSAINVDALKRANHPNSKLLMLHEERPKEFLELTPGMVDLRIDKRLHEDPKAFEMRINSPVGLKNKDLFSRYYSGGPLEYDNQPVSVC